MPAPPAVAASLLVHAAAAAGVAAWPEAWAAALGVLAANHALLTVLGLLPRSQTLGATLVRLPRGDARRRVALTFDDGPDPATTPLVLDLLDRHGAKATFFCVGRRAARHPELMREIRRRGHAVANHTMRHRPWFALLGPGGQDREVREAHAALAATGAVSPYVRTPLGIRSPLSWAVFRRRGLAHVSWSRRGYDTRCGEAAEVFGRVTARVREGDIILLHDGNAARTADGEAVSVAVLRRLLPWLAARGLRSVALDARWAAAARAEAPAGPVRGVLRPRDRSLV